MGILVKLFHRSTQGRKQTESEDLPWSMLHHDEQRKPQQSYLYEEEEQMLLRDFNLSLIITKMAFQLAVDREVAMSIMAKQLQSFVLLDLERPRKEYLYQLTKIAREESARFAACTGFMSFETLGRCWQRSGKDLYDTNLSMGPLGEQLEGKLQHVLRKYALLAKVPYLTKVTRFPEEPSRIEMPRFQAIRPFVGTGIPCACFEDACAMAQSLAPAIARDEQEDRSEHYMSCYY
ncbi:hypothetical protein EDD73_13225 [Heliophilum fasciatum]|uniref:Uncharacterized protein n=2 Tax=Heliophilum fasciatum TaxID=35700 RepID=A0A4V2SW48_9FIRM|nr:hypothetical protein EDD73_13225 [Heliophilum fasciatum]